ELMGRKAGWLALAAGLAGGGDIILLPEIPYDIESNCRHLTERRRRGKWFSIVAVAEGAVSRRAGGLVAGAQVGPGKGEKRKKGKKEGRDGKLARDKAAGPGADGAAAPPDVASEGRVSSVVAKAISQRLGIETRVTVLGHLQRGGIPTPFDRVLATRFGVHAAEMLAQGVYNHMVCMKGAEVTSAPLEQVAGKVKLVPPDHPLIRAARRVGTNFGD